jgi:DNA-binding MarR family transcriptional regulator
VRTASSSVDLAHRLRPVIARTSRRLRQEGGAELSPTLTAPPPRVELHGPLTPSELAARERVRRPTVTRVVARLEADGLVARTAAPADGRSTLVAVTAEGRELLDQMRTRKDAYLARRLEALGAHERAVLERAAAILERMLEEEDA